MSHWLIGYIIVSVIIGGQAGLFLLLIGKGSAPQAGNMFGAVLVVMVVVVFTWPVLLAIVAINWWKNKRKGEA